MSARQTIAAIEHSLDESLAKLERMRADAVAIAEQRNDAVRYLGEMRQERDAAQAELTKLRAAIAEYDFEQCGWEAEHRQNLLGELTGS